MTTTHVMKTSAVNVSADFAGSPRLAANLQQVLVDLTALHLQAKQAHWNLVGPNFRDLHLQLDEIVDLARESSDTIAERMRALRATPDARPETVTAHTRLPKFPPGEQTTTTVVDLITDRLRSAAHTARELHGDVDAEDPTTADLLHTIIAEVEKQSWMLSAETRGA